MFMRTERALYMRRALVRSARNLGVRGAIFEVKKGRMKQSRQRLCHILRCQMMPRWCQDASSEGNQHLHVSVLPLVFCGIFVFQLFFVLLWRFFDYIWRTSLAGIWVLKVERCYSAGLGESPNKSVCNKFQPDQMHSNNTNAHTTSWCTGTNTYQSYTIFYIPL